MRTVKLKEIEQGQRFFWLKGDPKAEFIMGQTGLGLKVFTSLNTGRAGDVTGFNEDSPVVPA